MIAAENITSGARQGKGKGWGVVVTGKGGVGKTTVAAILAHCAATEGDRVLAIDATRGGGLAASLGIPLEWIKTQDLPVSDSRDQSPFSSAKDHTGPEVPAVEDVIPRSGIRVTDRLNLLLLKYEKGAAVNHLSLESKSPRNSLRSIEETGVSVFVLDTDPDIELEVDATAPLFQHVLIVSEPTFNSLRIAEKITRDMFGKGILYLYLVMNKMRSEEDAQRMKRFLGGLTCYERIFSLPYDEEVLRADPDVSILLKNSTPFAEGVTRIYRAIRDTESNRGENT
ncbi:MAG: AAA family ATPase [Methanomicrobiales archaeon]|nr:AAA family ATPase [Methanomicrobiales archaeon]